MITLENEIASALTADAITAEALQSLVARAETAIAEADADVKRHEAATWDPMIGPDPRIARDAHEDALVRAGRLRTLLTRCRRRHAALEAEQRKQAFEAEFGRLKNERNVLANELIAVLPELTAKLIDLFTRITLFDQKIGKLHQSRPSGVPGYLTGVELEARKLEAFSRDCPPILNKVILFDINTGKQSWPPVVRRDLSLMVPVIDEPGRNADWWRPEILEAKKVEAAREQKRLADYYESKEKERAQREERERVAAK